MVGSRRAFHFATMCAWLMLAGCGGESTQARAEAAADAPPGPIADAGSETATVRAIGPEGGSVALGQALLIVPPGALTQSVVISITLSPLSTPAGYVAYSPLFRFEHGGLQFTTPVFVSLPFYGNPAAPMLVWSSSSNDDYIPIKGSISGSNLIAQVTHFSLGFVGERIDAGVVVGDEKIDVDGRPDASGDPDVSIGTPDANPDRGSVDASVDNVSADDVSVNDVTVAEDGTVPGEASSDSGSPPLLTPVGPGVSCGSTVCTGATPECCVPWYGAAPSCVASGGCKGIEEKCDGFEDCASDQICCFDSRSTRCASSGGVAPCGFWSREWGQLVACHSDVDCTSTEAPYCELEDSWRFTVPICHSACTQSGPNCYIAAHSRFTFPLNHPVAVAQPGSPTNSTIATPGEVGCGSTNCAIPNRCCTTNCVGPMALCRMGRDLRCDGPEDCPGTSCCYTFGGPAFSSCGQCKPDPSAILLGGGALQFVVCHTDADCPNREAPFCRDFSESFGICLPPCLGVDAICGQGRCATSVPAPTCQF